jgi:hypothetical protein
MRLSTGRVIFVFIPCAIAIVASSFFATLWMIDRLTLVQNVRSLPEAVLVQQPFPTAEGGYIDSLELGKKIVIKGWGMLSLAPVGQHVFVQTDLPVASISIAQVPRPDVAAALHDERLIRSGINIVLTLNPGAPIPSDIKQLKLCIDTSDPIYGTYLLASAVRPGLCPNVPLKSH